MSRTEVHHGHKNIDVAYHVVWDFRRDALRWLGNAPIGINFHPLATDFREWLLRKGSFPVLARDDDQLPYNYSNPYTFHGSVLASILANCINDAHDFHATNDIAEPAKIEMQRIRIYNEFVLYAARLCEALIKQLLHCTQIGKKYYKTASLGTLLSTECRGCRNSKSQRHKLSLLGSLAHRYHLCLEFEHCLSDHLRIVGRRRNIEAAHSDTQFLNIRTAEESRAQMSRDLLEIGSDLVHMLQHIAEIEQSMIGELVDRYPSIRVSGAAKRALVEAPLR